MMLIHRRFLVSVIGCGLISVPAPVVLAQSSAPSAQQQAQPASDQDQNPDFDPLNRPRSDQQRARDQKLLRQELSETYKKWLDEEVPYIITDQEKKAFLSLSNDEERDAFIEAF